MFQLDDTFLESVGLGALPEEQKKPFLQHVYDQLEMRVGASLSEGMSDQQLDQFEAIIDRRDEIVTPWLQQNAPNYQSEEVFLRLQQSMQQPIDSPALRAEYAATKWLEVNRPDYRDVVARTLESLRQEISQNRDAILGPQPKQ